jgi:hypothetical protein
MTYQDGSGYFERVENANQIAGRLQGRVQGCIRWC